MKFKELLDITDLYQNITVYVSKTERWSLSLTNRVKEDIIVQQCYQELREYFNYYVVGITRDYVVDTTLLIILYKGDLETLLEENREKMFEAVLPKQLAEDLEHNVSINEMNFIEVAIGIIYSFAPFYKPRKIDLIVEHIHKYFEEHRVDKVFKPHIVVKNKTENIASLVNTILLSCNEFVELNLSEKEYEKNIAPNDSNRPKALFVSGGEEVSPVDDFIDLEACCAAITSELKRRTN